MTPTLLDRILAPLRARMSAYVTRGLLQALDDSGALQRLKVRLLDGEILDNVERYAQYGFVSSPPEGSEVVAIALGGNRDSTIVVATEDRRYRLKGLAEGEVALYTDLGQEIRMQRDGRIRVAADKIELAGTDEVMIQAPEIKLAGSTSVAINTPNLQAISQLIALLSTGQVAISGTTVTINGIDFSAHFHGGVQSGGSNTGPPQ